MLCNSSDRIINKFIKLIERTGPEKRLLEFFQAICSCKGLKIVSNQENCIRLLYRNVRNRRSLLIETAAFDGLEGYPRTAWEEAAPGVRSSPSRKFVGPLGLDLTLIWPAWARD